jgi:hypothetical protein
MSFTVKCLILTHTADPRGDGKPKERNVTILDEQAKDWDTGTEQQRLDIVYMRGQNDFSEGQPEHNTTASLSVADVIYLPDRDFNQPIEDPDDVPYTIYAVCGVGFKPITSEELQQLIDMEPHDRHFCDLLREKE